MNFSKYLLISTSIVISLAFTWSNYKRNIVQFTKEDALYKVLQTLGEPVAKHQIDSNTPQLIKTGEELITKGYSTNPAGKRSKKISPYYVCISCHNTSRENTDLKNPNAQNQLIYNAENKTPYLQGTTFWGIVNRASWYNDDYQTKYGDLAKKANFDLEESIQLCAQECSQGRVLETWELKAILAYFWSLEIKLNDLDLSDQLLTKISTAKQDSSKKALITELKALYSQRASAHFITAKDELQIINQLPPGDPANGKLFFETSCKHCHSSSGVSFMNFKATKRTKNKFTKNLGSGSLFDLYRITREGTRPIAIHKTYMPLYTKERMSSQQLKDLISYLTFQK